jgi:hypothetical protein
MLFVDDLHYGYLIVERDGVELQFFRHGGLDPAQCDLGAYVRCESVAEVHGWFGPLNLGAARGSRGWSRQRTARGKCGRQCWWT